MGKRWRIFTVLAFLYVIAYFYRVSMAVVARDVAASLSLSAARLGILSGAFFYAFACAQIPLGPLLDRFGGRLMVTLTALLTIAGSFVFAAAAGYPAALAGRILLGAGSACVLMGALKVFSNWYAPREFATVSGLIVAIGNLGNLAATAPLALAVGRFGWRAPFVAVGALQTMLTLLVFRVVRDRPSDAAAGEEGHPHPGVIAGWLIIARTPSFWLLSFLAFSWYGTYMALQGMWGGPYLMEALGLTRTAAGGLLLLTSLGFITGCLFIGKVTDRLLKSRKWTLLSGQCLLLLLTSALLGPVETMAPLLRQGWYFAIGLAVSSGVTIYPMLKEMFPHALTATALTTANFFVLMGAAVCQQLMGLFIERFPRGGAGYPPAAYHGAFLLPLGCLALALLLFCFARDTGPGEPQKP